jgi:hypothetical protein
VKDENETTKLLNPKPETSVLKYQVWIISNEVVALLARSYTIGGKMLNACQFVSKKGNVDKHMESEEAEERTTSIQPCQAE